MDQNTIKELAAVKALFQQRSILAIIHQRPVGSKQDQKPDQTEGGSHG